MKLPTRITSGALIAGALLVTGCAAVTTGAPAAIATPPTSQTVTAKTVAAPARYDVLSAGNLNLGGSPAVSARFVKGTLPHGFESGSYFGNIYAKASSNGVSRTYRIVADASSITSSTMVLRYQLFDNNTLVNAGSGTLTGKNYRYDGALESGIGGSSLTVTDLTLAIPPAG